MQLTATSKFTSLAKGVAKYLEWKIYIKKTTDITEALTAGTWTEVTDRVEPFNGNSLEIEFESGQFAANAISLKGIGRAWWKANVFNASASQHIELKVTFRLGLSESNMATDLIYTFSGYVDKKNVRYREVEDVAEFSAYSADELGNRLAGENVSTQYVDEDIDGSGTDGLVLFDIPGLYVKDANIASYVLKSGVHTITYEYNGGSRRAKLDSGDYVSLTGVGAFTLANSGTTEKLQVYVKVVGALPTTTQTETVIVTVPGTTLPNQWYRGISARVLLTEIFEAVGITTITFDTLAIAAYNSTAKISFLDIPPLSGSITGYKWAMTNDGTDLYIGVGHRIYKRTMSSDTYTLKCTLTAGDRISKLIYNARNNHLWIYYGAGGTGEGKVRRYDIGGDSLSAETAIANSDKYSFQIFDYEDATLGWEYCALYVNNSTHAIMRVDGSSLAVTTLFTQAALGYGATDGPALGFSYLRTNIYGFTSFSTNSLLDEIRFDNVAHGGWGFDGSANTNVPDGAHAYGASYDPDEDRVYYWDSINDKVRYHDRTSTTGNDVLTLSSTEIVEEIHFANSKSYFTVKDNGGSSVWGKLYSAEAGAATLLTSTPQIYSKYFALTFVSSTLFGLDQAGRLWKYSATLAMYVDTADFEGITVKEALTKTLRAFNLIGTISPAKKAFVLRRGNDSGVAQTTGSSVTITTAEAGELERSVGHQPKYDYVSVTNGVTTYSYDGTTFNALVLSTARKLEVENSLIPDEIVQDVCYYAYQFWKTERDLFVVPLSLVSLFQYEPSDGVTLSGFQDVSSATGIIVGVGFVRDGSMTLKILSPLS